MIQVKLFIHIKLYFKKYITLIQLYKKLYPIIFQKFCFVNTLKRKSINFSKYLAILILNIVKYYFLIFFLINKIFN